MWKLEDPAVLARERQQREQEKVTFVLLPSCSFGAPIRVLFLLSTKSFFSPHCVCVCVFFAGLSASLFFRRGFVPFFVVIPVLRRVKHGAR